MNLLRHAVFLQVDSVPHNLKGRFVQYSEEGKVVRELTIANATRKKLKDSLGLEYEFYDFAVRRLKEQYAAMIETEDSGR